MSEQAGVYGDLDSLECLNILECLECLNSLECLEYLNRQYLEQYYREY